MASVFPGSDIFLEKVFRYAAHTESGTNIWAALKIGAVLFWVRTEMLIPKFKYSNAVGVSKPWRWKGWTLKCKSYEVKN